MPRQVLISEVGTGTNGTARQEFIELYNPTDQAIDLSKDGWKLQKSTDSSENWQTVTDFTGTIQPRGFYLLATPDWFSEETGEILPTAPPYWTAEKTEVADFFSAKLSDAGGHLRLVQEGIEVNPDTGIEETTEEEADRVGWGSAQHAENEAIDLADTSLEICNSGYDGFQIAAPEGARDYSLRRCFNEEGKMVDSNNNAADFALAADPSPTNTPAPTTDVPHDDLDEEPGGIVDDEDTPAPEPELEYLTLEITELLPDPTSPQTDARDEFVEIFNPNSVSVNLKDYVIQTGGNLQYSFKLPSVSLAPGSYKAFYSREGKITLANSGGRVQLLAPDGDVASPLVKYPTAVTGESYALIKGSWAWTNQATPNKANLERKKSSDPAKSPDPASLQIAVRTSYPRLMITEVFPDPASPFKDAEDEFVEIYNPNTFAVNLKGYILRSGSTLKTKYALPDVTIKPGQHLVYFSDTAKLSLPNKGGSVRLEGENAQLIYEINPYPKAITGASWSLISGHWQWSAKPTPAAVNQAANTGKEESGSAGVRSAQDQFKNQDALVGLTAPAVIGPSRYSSVAVSVAASLALLYLIYEFRHDLRSKIYLLRKRITSLSK